MRALIAVCFIALAIAASDYRKCCQDKCAKEQSACEAHLSCLTIATGCWSKCGQDDQCYVKCFEGKSDQYLDTLVKCGEKNCKNAFTAQLETEAPLTNDCTQQTILTCIQQFALFGSQCYTESGDLKACATQFISENPQCLCQVNIF